MRKVKCIFVQNIKIISDQQSGITHSFHIYEINAEHLPSELAEFSILLFKFLH